MSEFTYDVPDTKAYLYTLRLYLQSINRQDIADLLGYATCNIDVSSSYSRIRWNSYATTIVLYVPIAYLSKFTDNVREILFSSANDVFPKDAGYDITELQISPLLETPSDEDSLGSLEKYGQSSIPKSGDLFRHQFPAGLPLSLKKPNLAFVPEQGSQRAYFEDEPEIGIIRDNVYPNFTFEDLRSRLEGKPIAQGSLAKVLTAMNQTEWEKNFFTSYASEYGMWYNKVPVLIPQAWIQWHSKPKRDLREKMSSYADDLYRVDFVAFWNWRRFAILIDDIRHYGVQLAGRWDASEEAYSKRLKEDRKLRREGWQVFRVSNWEIKKANSLTEILNDLREYMGFEKPKVEDIPF